jgi:hypothetical protein
MVRQIIITTPDENADVSEAPETPGRYEVTKHTTVTTTVTTQTWIDVQVIDDPNEGRVVIFGFNAANGTVTGLQELIDAYGHPDVCRVFSGPGKGIMAWNNPLLQLLKSDCVLVYSFKDWPLTPGVFAGWMTTKPADRFPEVWVCLDHEPEQGPDSGDPDPVTYRRQWTELLAVYNTHARKDEFFPIPIFTEFYARQWWDTPNPSTGGTWQDDFGVVVEFHGIRGVGFDVYDTGHPTYRTPEHRNEIPFRVAQRAQLPLLICELNIANKSFDEDDTGAAEAFRRNTDYLRNEVTHPVPYVMQYHLGGGNLINRPEVQEAFIDAIDGNPN